ncbi:MAG TPA: hypothetical protein VJR23_13585 [Candidatus Acidoferrales bacterium]|nr:hypothetical protein [Candidatus Acidoferrales bacterium]
MNLKNIFTIRLFLDLRFVGNPKSPHRKLLRIPAGVWPNGKAAVTKVEISLHDPLLVDVTFLVALLFVAVFNDASRGDIGQSKRLRQDLQAPAFYYNLVKRLALKLDNAAIRTNRPCPKVVDAAEALCVGNFNIAVLRPGLSENLDAHVFEYRGVIFVNRILAIQNHRIRAGALWIVLQRKILL